MTSDKEFPDRFLISFFGDGNGLQWEKVQLKSRNSQSEALKPFLLEVTNDWERLILPRIKDDLLIWYGVARDSRTARVLRDELLAFVGPSYSDFSGQYATLDPKDPVDRAVIDLPASHVFQISVVDSALKNNCRKALLNLLEIRNRRPKRIRMVIRPSGRVLRDFELAIQNRTRTQAADYLDELREQGGANARNIRFLKVYLYEAFEEWNHLYDLLDEGSLVMAQRPTRVTKALIRALYRRELAGYESSKKTDKALTHFKEIILPRFGRLFTSLTALEGPEVTKSFLLASAASRPPKGDRRDILLKLYPQSAPDRPYVEALARLIPVGTEEATDNSLTVASRAFANGDLDKAFELLGKLEPSQTVLELMMRSAVEIGSIEAASKTILALDNAPRTILLEFKNKPRIQKAFESLKNLFSDDEATTPNNVEPPTFQTLPQNWQGWLERVISEPFWPKALKVAEQGSQEWSVEEAIHSPEEMRAFAEALNGSISEPSSEVLQNAVPYLLEFFVRRCDSTRVFAPVQESLLDWLLYLDTPSIESIRATGVLMDALMRHGMKQETCRRMIQDIQEAWLGQASFELLDWALDVLDSLVTLQVAPKDLQASFASALLGQFLKWRERLTTSQVALFIKLCRECELSVDRLDCMLSRDGNISIEESNSFAQRISGKVIALYSLRTEVLYRSKAVIEFISQNVIVHTFSDTVGNKVLLKAARTADIFLIVTGAAKHAATEFIEKNRPKEALTLRCHTTGTASLLRVLEEEA